MDIAKWSTEVKPLIQAMAEPLDARVKWRLACLLLGALLAQGRRTVTGWLRVLCVGKDFRLYYYFLGSLGRKISSCARVLLDHLVAKMDPGERWLFAIDDTPTKRYGPFVEGAGIHHNPTPGPADQALLFGHVWVTLAWVVRHRRWGTLALPLLSKLYVRACDVGKLAPCYGWPFATKLELAGQLLSWLHRWLERSGKAVWVVVDGFYNKREFLREAREQQMVVVGRLAKNASLRDVPKVAKKRGRGAPRKYGTKRVSLSKRAAHPKGWQEVSVWQYGKERVKKVKTFVATWRPARGAIRVVIVRESRGWLAYSCTALDASVASILEAAAGRTSIEQTFCDVKEVHGAGQQQLRNIWANIGAWHVLIWLYSLIEWWSWKRSDGKLRDRCDRPWDQTERRVSHAEKRKALQGESLREEYSRGSSWSRVPTKIRKLFQRLLKLAA